MKKKPDIFILFADSEKEGEKIGFAIQKFCKCNRCKIVASKRIQEPISGAFLIHKCGGFEFSFKYPAQRTVTPQNVVEIISKFIHEEEKDISLGAVTT